MKSRNNKLENRKADWMRNLPLIKQEEFITRRIVQVFLYGSPDSEITEQLNITKINNPDWEFILLSNDEIEKFILDNYGSKVLSCYQSIEKSYGAAKVDLFRYLYIYRYGGVYLDIKSGFLTRISQVINGNEKFILSQWRNGCGEIHSNIGLHPDLVDIKGGEFQNFHIIGVAGHPFLRAVIASVLANIEEYSPWQFSVGKIGVLRLTGPIAYTKAIYPLLSYHEHKRVRGENMLNLSASIYPSKNVTKRPHYSTLDGPIVTLTGIKARSFDIFLVAYRIKKRMQAILRK